MADWFRNFWGGGDSSPDAGLLSRIVDWASANPDKAIGTTLLLVSAPFVAWVWWRKNMRPVAAPVPSPVAVNSGPRLGGGTDGFLTLTLEAYEKRLRDREAEVEARLQAVTGEERTRISAERTELRSRLADVEPAFEQARTRIIELEALLAREGNQAAPERLARAEAALTTGDLDDADALLAEISAEEDLAVQRKARAEYGRGQIAEEKVHWFDAARHYAAAADAVPSFKHLRQHWEFLWKLAQTDRAIIVAKDLRAAAVSEFGETSEEYGTALSCHGISVKMSGDYAGAEPIYRDAIKLSADTNGEDHPDHATHLSNLANLLRAMRRLDEAEPLYRQAMAITEATVGETHRSYASRLNNLANLLQDMDNLDEAEPLFRQAMVITGATVGETHPDYATHLNNLASLLQDMGRLDEAEPLYRQALEILVATIGAGHPDYASNLNNLALLLRDMAKPDAARPLFAEAVAILRDTLGDGHPNTKLVVGSYGGLLRAEFPEDPALAELEAAFGTDVGMG